MSNLTQEKKVYTQEEQTEIVRDAMRLTAAIQIGEEEIDNLRDETFKPMPAAPVHKVLQVPQIRAEIPVPPKAQYGYVEFLKEFIAQLDKKYNKILVRILFVVAAIVSLLMGLAPVWIGIPVSFVFYSKKKKEKNQELAQTPEYLAAVKEAEDKAAAEQSRVNDETAKKQAEIDAQFKTDMEHYENVLVPAYNQEFAQWRETQSKKIAMLEDDLRLNSETLENLYEVTRMVSLDYRELWILRWLYDDMRTSDHEIRYATELFDRGRQRFVTEQSGRMVSEAIGEMQADMMSGFGAVYEAIDEGNEKLAKMRRDQNIANTVGIAQRYNLNKKTKEQNEMLNKQNEMLNKRFNG